MLKAWWNQFVVRFRRIPIWVRWLAVILLIPLIEYAVLVWISETFGFTLTLFLVLASGVTGTWATKQQGAAAWRRILTHVRGGEPVGEPIFDAVLVLFAGVMLIMPGVVSDIFGFALLTPRIRVAVRERLARWLRQKAMMQVQAFHADGRVTMQKSAAEETTETGVKADTNDPEKIAPIQVIDPEREAAETSSRHA